jgi:hypothetical protein
MNYKEQVNHFGARNVQSVLNWMRHQQFQLNELVLMGCSAGSVGLQFHTHEILTS